MPELYTTPDLTKAIEAAKRTFEYFKDSNYGPADVHTVDAALFVGAQVNVLTRGHVDNSPMFAAGDKEACCNRGLSLVEEWEKQPKASPAGADPSDLDPATILLLFQIGNLVKQLFGW